MAPGNKILSINDIENWIKQGEKQSKAWELIAATFVIDCQGYLRIADRQYEHIACAGGESVLSAGEIFFQKSTKCFEVAEITNQSMGFSPRLYLGSTLIKHLILFRFRIHLHLASSLSADAVTIVAK